MDKQINEWPVGEQIRYKGHIYKVVEYFGCNACAFSNIKSCAELLEFGLCSAYNRKDHKSVIFKLIE